MESVVSFWGAARFLARELAHALEEGMDLESAKRTAGEALLTRCGVDDEKSVRQVSFMVAFVEKWVASGLPHVSLGDRIAASFCATSVPPEVANLARLPFHCFGLSIPPGVFGSLVDMFVVDAKNVGWVRYLLNESDGFAVGEERDLGCFADMGEIVTTFPEDRASEHERKLRLLGRVIVGIALEMSSVPTGTPRASGGGKKKRDSDLPRTWEFRINRPVTFDARPHVREYLTGNRPSLSMQRIVRGHWQRYHARDGLIWKHKEPYFQGDADAPIVARSVIVR
jgi:hypothetical protein